MVRGVVTKIKVTELQLNNFLTQLLGIVRIDKQEIWTDLQNSWDHLFKTNDIVS